MTRTLILFGAFAGLLAGSAAQAEELANQPASLGKPILTSTITCNGNPNVPMTADQEQSLPLKVIASLECGQEVTVLSDIEGYTVNILTEDAKKGYVARMYLSRPTWKRLDTPTEDSTMRDGVARWQPGTKGSSQFMSGEQLVESLTANGITVQVSLQDTGWKMRANVAVVNASTQPVYILPRLLSLDEVAPMVKPLRYQDPARIAKAANHQILWTSASAGSSSSTQQRSSSAPSANNAYAVSYKMPLSTPAPNYLAEHQAAEQLAAKNQAALVDMVREINVLSLRESTLKPSDKTAGAVWFERDAKSRQLILRVPVGGVIFEFPLSFNHEK